MNTRSQGVFMDSLSQVNTFLLVILVMLASVNSFLQLGLVPVLLIVLVSGVTYSVITRGKYGR